MTVCIGETLAQLPDRAQRLSNWATTATTTAAGTAIATAGKAAAISTASAAGGGTVAATNKLKNNTGNGTSSGGGSVRGSGSVGVVFSLSHLRELPHVLVVNEWGLHHHRYLSD